MSHSHTDRCLDMALTAIIENNDATLVTEGVRGTTPETSAEAAEWLANGNAECHTPERCAHVVPDVDCAAGCGAVVPEDEALPLAAGDYACSEGCRYSMRESLD